MSTKNRKGRKIEVSTEDKGLRHNPFAELLKGADRSALRDGPSGECDDEAGRAERSEESLEDGLRRAGKVVLRRQRKGRGGRTVTLVEGLEDFSDTVLEELAGKLKKGLGTGAVVEEGVVVVQGDQGDRLKEWLEAQGVRKIVL